MTIQHLLAPSGLPFPSSCGISPKSSLSVLSYNVLLPNSIDGWWNYKMYNPVTLSEYNLQNNQDISSWEYRQELLKQKIRSINADVVCLQEVSPQSFEDDFLFMKEELGYYGCEMFKRGRFRPATFWKTDRCSLVGEAVHKDRTLLTVFEVKDSSSSLGGGEGDTEEEKKVNEEGVDGENDDEIIVPQYWHVLNCHLQAGLQAKRRLRQIEEGVKASCRFAKEQHKVFVNRNHPKKKKRNQQQQTSSKATPSNVSVDSLQYPNLIVCGDFNGGSECAAVRYLEDGVVTPEFLEDGHPTTSKVKKLPNGIPVPSQLLDVPSLSLSSSTSTSIAPDTMIVSELISNMIHPDSSDDEPILSNGVMERLERIYNRLATSKMDSSSETMVMGVEDVERWLCQINGKVGRGTEFRNAAVEMGWKAPPPPDNNNDDDNNDNNNNDAEAKSNDNPKETDRVRPPITIPPNSTLSLSSFQKVYQMELHQGKFWGIAHDLAVLGEPMPDAGLYKARFDRMYCTSNLRPYAVVHTECDVPCPNAVEPSDHLPVAASFTLN